jgi:hypothetical protein
MRQHVIGGRIQECGLLHRACPRGFVEPGLAIREITRFWLFAACLDLFGRALLFEHRLLPPFFEVFTHVLRFHAVESRAGDYCELEASFLEQIQSAIVAQSFPRGCLETLQALFPGRIVAVGAAVYDESPDTVALFVQLILNPIGRIATPAARVLRAGELVEQGGWMRWSVFGVLGRLYAGVCRETASVQLIDVLVVAVVR